MRFARLLAPDEGSPLCRHHRRRNLAVHIRLLDVERRPGAVLLDVARCFTRYQEFSYQFVLARTWSATLLKRPCSPSPRVLWFRKMQIAFRFAHAPARSTNPHEAHIVSSCLRRSQMLCNPSSRDSSYVLFLPPFAQARLPHDFPARAICPHTHAPRCTSSLFRLV